MISKPLVRRTLATLRSAEFGFFGVVVYTRVHTPRRCGQFCIAGDLDLTTSTSRPWRTSWLMVGMGNLFPFEVTCSEIPRQPTRVAFLVDDEKERARERPKSLQAWPLEALVRPASETPPRRRWAGMRSRGGKNGNVEAQQPWNCRRA